MASLFRDIFLMCASPQIVNPQMFMDNPQIANRQFSTKYSTTLTQNSPKAVCFKRFVNFTQILIRAFALCFKRKSMYLRILS
jgi:hypothetical protein